MNHVYLKIEKDTITNLIIPTDNAYSLCFRKDLQDCMKVFHSK